MLCVSGRLESPYLQQSQSDSHSSLYREELPFRSQPALFAWDNYVADTKHTKRFFIERDERINSMLAAAQRQVEILEGHAASLRAKAIKAAGRPQSSTARMLEFEDDEDLAGKGKTKEEILLEDICHLNAVRSSQLSPFMGEAGAKLLTRHDVVITTKFPEGKELERAREVFHRYCTSAQKMAKTGSCTKKAPSTARAKDLEIKRLNKMEKRFEMWMKAPLLTDRARKEFDRSCKELKTRGCVAFDYKKLREEKKMQERQIRTLDPYDKLEEKVMFNALFGSDIKQKLQKYSQEQYIASQFPGSESRDEYRTADDAGLGKKRSKLKLLNDVNKIKVRYCNSKEIFAQQKAVKEKKAIEHFANKIKRGNEYMKNSFNAILARTQKALYNDN
eukprot:TRINITY_DN9482_c0_g3_i1.p1 TRINITY_DN9482_c0_g3~~TRINITY_DN9482_c0_g3_i1.p1  ORF type:complete len:390 (-),score=110.39 TRINITY_DN9482_c0_g3_i1:69-1238(-)